MAHTHDHAAATPGVQTLALSRGQLLALIVRQTDRLVALHPVSDRRLTARRAGTGTTFPVW